MPNFSDETLEAAMQAALAEAGKAAAAGEFPYGAVVVASNGEIIARAQDRVVRDNDPTMHAEIEVVRAAIRILGPDLSGYALVSNVEACAMCATAAWWAHIDLVAYGISQAELFAIRPDSMEEVGLSIAEAQAPFATKMEIRPNVLREDAEAPWVRTEA